MKYQNIRWNPEIEYIRGIAILFIIAIHTFGYFTLMNVHNFLFYSNAAVDVFSHIGVPIFIFVSGFVLAIKYRNQFSLKSFFKRRIPRILIPYLTFSIFYLLLFIFLSGSQLIQNQKELSQLTINEALFRLISGTAHYHLWFMILILELYILYPIIIKNYEFFSKSHKEYLFLFLLFIVQVIMSILNYYYPATDLFFVVFLSYIFYFVLGIFLSDNYSKFKDRVLNLKKEIQYFLILVIFSCTIILTLIFIQDYTFYFESHNSFFVYYYLIYPIFFIFTLIILFSLILSLECSEISSLKEFLKILSKYSFGIYLIHPFFIEAVYYLVIPKVEINVNNWIFYVILFISGLFFSVITLKLLEKIPHTSLFLGVK